MAYDQNLRKAWEAQNGSNLINNEMLKGWKKEGYYSQNGCIDE